MQPHFSVQNSTVESYRQYRKICIALRVSLFVHCVNLLGVIGLLLHELRALFCAAL